MGQVFSFLKSEESLCTYCGPGEEYLSQVSSIHEAVGKHCPRVEVDWELIHEAGQTFDDSELPHHVSSKQEISALLSSTEKLLDFLGSQPTIITISRSSIALQHSTM